MLTSAFTLAARLLFRRANLGGELFRNRLGFSERAFGSSAHQIELPFARLGDARSHACFERLRAGFMAERLSIGSTPGAAGRRS